MRVLFVCTANICRSPMAAGLFVKAAHERDISGAYAASAGFLESGNPINPHVATVFNERGIDGSRKRSQQLSAPVVEKADLILTMTSEHARGVVGRHPDTIRRVFTFRHFATAVTARSPEESTADWLDQIDRTNRRAYLGDDDVLDISDPIGHPYPVYAELAVELTGAIAWMLDCAYPRQARTA